MDRKICAQKDGKKVKLYTGSYNAPVLTGDGEIYQGAGKGIQVFLFDEENGILEEAERYPEIENASWLSFSPDGRMLYAVNELDDYQKTRGGALSALAVDERGGLTLKNCLPVFGAAPCHVDCDRSGKHVFTANYSGGSLSCFEVGEDGSLKRMDLQIAHHLEEGSRPQGINELRQEKPHVHSTSVFGEYLWVADLGADEVSVYQLDGIGNIVGGLEGHAPSVFRKVRLPAGSGPRSFAFGKGGSVYVTCELSNQIGILHWEKDGITVEGFVSSTSEVERTDEKGRRIENFPGGIALSEDGRYLYVGNRGHDSIGVFAVSAAGTLKGIQQIASGGKNPRGFQLSPSGRWLIAANQGSDNMVVFRRDEDTGMLMEHAKYEAGAVVCLKFL